MDEKQSYAPAVAGKAQVVEVDNVAFADAIAKSNVRPFTRRMLALYCFCFVATLNSCINGYDGSLMGAINAMESYKNKFGTVETGTTTPLLLLVLLPWHRLTGQ